MAIYHLSAKTISRTSGRSAVAAAAYRSGERLLNERDGRAHDFRARSGVETTFIAGPEAAPSWAFDRQSLWSAVELHEVPRNTRSAAKCPNFMAIRDDHLCQFSVSRNHSGEG